jgi:hypothetical protein
MDENLRAQIETSLSNLDALIRRGRRVCDSLAADPADKSALVANRAWQQDCGLAIHQLSGGSKAHWLARAFSEAFLMRASSGGEVIEEVEPAELAVRLLAVLDQAVLSLVRMREGDGSSVNAGVAAPLPRKFEFVHDPELRPVVEQAYIDSRDAFDQGRYEVALINSCGILEAIVTDALEHAGTESLASVSESPSGKIATWSFNDRLAVAEKAGIIRGGCARLPEIARKYREFVDEEGIPRVAVSEQDAKRTTQVLHVVMRDLDPGR